MKIAITTRSFGNLDPAPLEFLRGRFSDIVINDDGKKLSEDESIAMIAGAAGVLAGTEKLSEKVFAACPDLKVVSRVGVGLDSVDLEAAKLHGIKVMNTPGVLSDAVAELTLGLMLDCLRHISSADRQVRAGQWKSPMGRLLKGKTVGIVGLGAIGRRLVELLTPFGVSVIACDVAIDESFAQKFGVIKKELSDLLKESDLVTIHAPLTDETRGMISAEQLKIMKNDSILINASRGGVVDDVALYEAIKKNRIGAAGLDVFEKEPYVGPLTTLDNVVLAPHMGSYALESRIEMEWAAARNLAAALGVSE